MLSILTLDVMLTAFCDRNFTYPAILQISKMAARNGGWSSLSEEAMDVQNR